MQPQLDEAGSLQVQLQLVPTDPIASAPEPLPPKRNSAGVSAAAAALVAAPVAGDYQFDTDEEGVAMLAVASESDDEAAGAPAGVAMMPILPKKVLELQEKQKQEEEERKAKEGEKEGQKEEETEQKQEEGAAASALPPRILSVAAKTPTRNLAMALVGGWPESACVWGRAVSPVCAGRAFPGSLGWEGILWFGALVGALP